MDAYIGFVNGAGGAVVIDGYATSFIGLFALYIGTEVFVKGLCSLIFYSYCSPLAFLLRRKTLHNTTNFQLSIYLPVADND